MVTAIFDWLVVLISNFAPVSMTIFALMEKGRTVTTMPKRINPRQIPATMADVQRAKDTATADACRVTLAIFFTALLDKEGMDAEQLQRIWREVEALSESVRDGYVSAPDLIRVLRDEYEIDIIGG